MNGLLAPVLALGNVIPAADHWHGGPGWWFLFPLFWILVIGIAILLLGGRGPWSPVTQNAHRETAVDVLERRYAEGELSLEDYRERRSVLTEQQGEG